MGQLKEPKETISILLSLCYLFCMCLVFMLPPSSSFRSYGYVFIKKSSQNKPSGNEVWFLPTTAAAAAASVYRHRRKLYPSKEKK